MYPLKIKIKYAYFLINSLLQHKNKINVLGKRIKCIHDIVHQQLCKHINLLLVK